MKIKNWWRIARGIKIVFGKLEVTVFREEARKRRWKISRAFPTTVAGVVTETEIEETILHLTKPTFIYTQIKQNIFIYIEFHISSSHNG